MSAATRLLYVVAVLLSTAGAVAPWPLALALSLPALAIAATALLSVVRERSAR